MEAIKVAARPADTSRGLSSFDIPSKQTKGNKNGSFFPAGASFYLDRAVEISSSPISLVMEKF